MSEDNLNLNLEKYSYELEKDISFGLDEILNEVAPTLTERAEDDRREKPASSLSEEPHEASADFLVEKTSGDSVGVATENLSQADAPVVREISEEPAENQFAPIEETVVCKEDAVRSIEHTETDETFLFLDPNQTDESVVLSHSVETTEPVVLPTNVQHPAMNPELDESLNTLDEAPAILENEYNSSEAFSPADLSERTDYVSLSGAATIRKDRAKHKVIPPAVRQEPPAPPQENKSALIDDYSSDEQRDDILQEVRSLVRKIKAKLWLMAALLAVSVYMFLGHFSVMAFILPDGLNPLAHPVVYLSVCACISGLSMLLNISPLLFGVRRIFKGKISSDGMTFLLGLCCIGFDIYFCLNPERFNAIGYTFDFLFLLALVLGLSRKRILACSLLSGFEMISLDQTKNVLTQPKNVPASNDVMAEIGLGADVLYASKADLVSGYLKRGFSENNGKRTLERFQFVMSLLMLLLCAALYLAGQISSDMLLIYITAGFAMLSPAFAARAYMLSGYKLGQKLSEYATIISGLEGAESFADAGILVINESELICCDDVKLHGMKLAEHGDIREILTVLSALFSKIGGCLDGFFLKMFEHEEQIDMPEVSGILYYEKRGYSATVGGKKVLVDTAAFMKKMKVAIPNIAVPEGQSEIYCAIDGLLNAVFVVSYTLPLKSKRALQMLDEKGMAIALIGANFQFDEQFYTAGLEHPENITVLSYASAAQCREYCACVPKTQAEIVTYDGIRGLARGLLAFDKTLLNAWIQNIFEITSGIFTLVLIVFMAIFKTDFSVWLPLQILAYQVLWSLPMNIAARINRI